MRSSALVGRWVGSGWGSGAPTLGPLIRRRRQEVAGLGPSRSRGTRSALSFRPMSPIRFFGVTALALGTIAPQVAAQRGAPPPPQTQTLIVPGRVWDGVDAAPHEGWAVLVRGERIEAVGPRAQITAPPGAT